MDMEPFIHGAVIGFVAALIEVWRERRKARRDNPGGAG